MAADSTDPRPPVSGRGYRRQTVGFVAGGILLVIFLGCMSIAIGNRTPDGVVLESGTLVQKGEASVPAGTQLDVYYPIPYAHPPNLELGDYGEECQLVEQHEDHFRIHNTHPLSHSVKWTARGVRAAEPAPATAPEPPAEPPPPEPVHAR